MAAYLLLGVLLLVWSGSLVCHTHTDDTNKVSEYLARQVGSWQHWADLLLAPTCSEPDSADQPDTQIPIFRLRPHHAQKNAHLHHIKNEHRAKCVYSSDSDDTWYCIVHRMKTSHHIKNEHRANCVYSPDSDDTCYFIVHCTKTSHHIKNEHRAKCVYSPDSDDTCYCIVHSTKTSHHIKNEHRAKCVYSPDSDDTCYCIVHCTKTSKPAQSTMHNRLYWSTTQLLWTTTFSHEKAWQECPKSARIRQIKKVEWIRQEVETTSFVDVTLSIRCHMQPQFMFDHRPDSWAAFRWLIVQFLTDSACSVQYWPLGASNANTRYILP